MFKKKNKSDARMLDGTIVEADEYCPDSYNQAVSLAKDPSLTYLKRVQCTLAIMHIDQMSKGNLEQYKYQLISSQFQLQDMVNEIKTSKTYKK